MRLEVLAQIFTHTPCSMSGPRALSSATISTKRNLSRTLLRYVRRIVCAGLSNTLLSQGLQHKNISTLYEYAPFLVLAGLKKDLRREGPALGLSGFLEESKQVTVEEVCYRSSPPFYPYP